MATNYWFTSDEHYGHHNIIKYCNRPFKSVEEMDDTIISNHNSMVTKDDIVIHAGDFALVSKENAHNYIRRLNGSHIFIKGSHDRWLNDSHPHEIWEKNFKTVHIVVCHYCMRTWPRGHHGSIQLYGHSHGKLPPIGKQYDIGVDSNGFCPVSFDAVVKMFENKID